MSNNAAGHTHVHFPLTFQQPHLLPLEIALQRHNVSSLCSVLPALVQVKAQCRGFSAGLGWACTRYCQVTSMTPKSSAWCCGVPCLHEETLHTHSKNWQFSSLVLNGSKSQLDCKSQLGSQEVLCGSLQLLIQNAEKQTKSSYTQRISDRTPHPLPGQRAAVTPASSLPPMLPEPQHPSVTFPVCYALP